jgi:ribosomal protein S14
MRSGVSLDQATRQRVAESEQERRALKAYRKTFEVAALKLNKKAKAKAGAGGKGGKPSNNSNSQRGEDRKAAVGYVQRSTRASWRRVSGGGKRSRHRIRGRCIVTGRSRGWLRRFQRSRIQVRDRARKGELACVGKVSW